MGGNDTVDGGAGRNNLLDEHGGTVVNGDESDKSLKIFLGLNEFNGGEAYELSIPDEVGDITLKKSGEAAFPAMYIQY